MKRRSVLACLVCLSALLVAGGCRPQSTAKTQVNVTGSTTILPIAQAAAEIYEEENPDVRVLVQGGGSSAGIEQVSADPNTDIGMSSRDLKEEEQNLGLTDIPIAIDAIAVIVNPENPVESLTSKQVKDMFAGRIRNWRDVGGPDLEIGLVNRDEASGTREAFSKLVLDEEDFDPSAAILPGTGQVRSVVATSRNAIGYISLGYVTDEVKAVKLDGVEPSVENIRNRRYVLQRTLHFLTKGKVSGETKKFIDFVLSDRIQQEVVGKEFVPISVVQSD